MPKASKHHIAIVGPMGVGKTTVAAHLSAATGIRIADSDEWIEAETGRDASKIASGEGVASLHELEARALEEMLSGDERRIITPAASTIDDEQSRRRLREAALVVWLDAPISVLQERMRGGRHRRALGPGELETLIGYRNPLFEEIADLRLDATDAPDRIALRIVESSPLS